MPFGAFFNIIDNNKYNNLTLFLLYISGVLGNLVLCFFSLIIKNDLLLNINIALLFYNLLPIYPLDGYNIILAIISNFLSYKKALYILNILSLFLAFVFLGSIFKFDLGLYNLLMIFFIIILNVFKLKSLNDELFVFYIEKYLNPNFTFKNNYIRTFGMKPFYKYKKGYNNIVSLNNSSLSEKEVLHHFYINKSSHSFH